MAELPVDAGLGMDWADGPLRALLDKRLGARAIHAPVDLESVWKPAHYGLDRVQAWTEADDDVRRAVLADCARASLLEAYFIEKAGVAYAAKMTLLAESADERSLYALFAAEEATHLDAIKQALGPVDEQQWQANPFLTLLRDIVEEADRATGQLVIQVVLEGWGLVHYAGLRDACQDRDLQRLLARIVADEAGHHGSGVHLLRGVSFAGAQRRAAVDQLGHMLAMVQVGPALVAGSLERHLGGFTRDQRLRVYRELDAEQHIRERLAKLGACLDKVPGAAVVAEDLTAAGRFTIPAVEALA
ncbi:MAG: ferritin-like domain-containing protein [Deltaproteobacteria bacterium]|nr:MAG: ferritin-like domain-containing protein [Deltaproteobacteria bacterium]